MLIGATIVCMQASATIVCIQVSHPALDVAGLGEIARSGRRCWFANTLLYSSLSLRLLFRAPCLPTLLPPFQLVRFFGIRVGSGAKAKAKSS